MNKEKLFKQKRILVTGGAGFIGSHLCEFLIEHQHNVICLDDFSTGRKKNIKNLLKYDSFKVIEHDVINPIDLNIDFIFHLASTASPLSYQSNPIKTVKTNVIGTINMLELAQKRDISLLFTSTSEIYGDPLQHPQSEEYWGNVNPISPRACYDEGKRCAESICFDYYRQRKVPIKVVRIFNTYGSRMRPDDGRVVSNFINQALSNQDITIYGDGLQTRSFQYIDDLIEGLILMAKKEDFIGPVNLGNPEEYTINELAGKIIEITNSKSRIVQVRPLPESDPKVRRPDITLAKAKLKWEPKIKLEEGLKKTVDYFKRNELIV